MNGSDVGWRARRLWERRASEQRGTWEGCLVTVERIEEAREDGELRLGRMDLNGLFGGGTCQDGRIACEPRREEEAKREGARCKDAGEEA